MTAIETAVADGGEVLTGGGKLTEIGGNFVEPTIIRMPAQTPLVCEETFAPILYIMAYDSLDEAIALHNAVPQGLSSAMFTRDLLAAERFPLGRGIGLRHRQHQHRHQWRGDRRRVRRRERDRRRARIRLGCLEGLYAPADEYD